MAHAEPLPVTSIPGVIQTQREALRGCRVRYLLLWEKRNLWKQFSMSLEGTTERKAVVRPQERRPSQKGGSLSVSFPCASSTCSLLSTSLLLGWVIGVEGLGETTRILHVSDRHVSPHQKTFPISTPGARQRLGASGVVLTLKLVSKESGPGV